MGGICGVVHASSSRPVPEAQVRAMLQSIRHRGPDGQSIRVADGAGVGACWVAIRDSGPQLAVSEDGAVWAALDGEIYDRQALHSWLAARRHKVRGESGAQLLPHLYEEFGAELATRIEGDFAFAVWDARERVLHLCRGRVGHKPLFYAEADEGLLFGSEIKAILSSGDVEPKPAPAAVADFLALGTVPQPTTCFEGVRHVPPASVVSWSRGRISTRPYWQFRFGVQDRISAAEAVERFRHLVIAATERRTQDVEPCASFLSGGMDCSVIVGTVSRLLNKPCTAFSVGFAEQEYSELPDAQAAAMQLGAAHKAHVVDPRKVPDTLRLAVWHHDAPLEDTSSIPVYWGARVAREHAPVVLTGDGPDQLFAGSGKHLQVTRDLDLGRRSPTQYIYKAVSWLLPLSLARRRTFLGRAARRSHRKGASRLRRLLWHFGEGHQVVPRHLLVPELREVNPARHWVNALERCGTEHPLEQALYLDFHFFLHDDLMPKVDRMTMACSLETRMPFLDTSLLELAMATPPEAKVGRDGGRLYSKWVQRQAFDDILPRHAVEKRKRGFMIPEARWYRNELKPFLQEVLLDDRTLGRPYFEGNRLRSLLEGYFAGREDDFTCSDTLVTRLVTLELWHRLYVDSRWIEAPSKP